MKNLKRAVPVMIVGIALSILVSSCKGRTRENMEPNGETVEVNIGSGDTAVSDTVIMDYASPVEAGK